MSFTRTAVVSQEDYDRQERARLKRGQRWADFVRDALAKHTADVLASEGQRATIGYIRELQEGDLVRIRPIGQIDQKGERAVVVNILENRDRVIRTLTGQFHDIPNAKWEVLTCDN